MADNLSLIAYPPPIKGLNTSGPPFSLDPQEARSLINWIPREGYLESRPGISFVDDQAITAGGTLNAIFMVNSTKGIVGVYPDSTHMDIYSLDTSTGLASFDAGLSCADMTYPLVSTVWKGSIIYAVDQTCRRWDGSAGSATGITVTGTPHITAIGNYRSRLYFGTSVSSIVYGAPDSYGGTFKSYNVGPYLRHNSHYITWVGPVSGLSIAANQNLLGVANSYGEILIYQGEYPGHNSWSLVGKYQLPHAYPNFGGSNHSYWPVTYIDSRAYYFSSEGVFDILAIHEGATLEQANIAKPIVDQLRIGLARTSQPTWSQDTNLFYLPCALRLAYAPRTDTYGLLVYNNNTKAWTAYIPADDSAHFGNPKQFFRCSADPDKGVVYLAVKDQGNDLNVGYFNSAVSTDYDSKYFSLSMAHAYQSGQEPNRYKTAHVWRPILNLSASSISGTYSCSTDTQTETPTWSATIAYSSSTFTTERQYPMNATGYMFAPRMTLTPAGTSTTKYLGSFLLHSYGGKL